MSHVENTKRCTKQTLNVFVYYQGDFAMAGGELQTKDCAPNAYQFLIDSTSQVSYTL